MIANQVKNDPRAKWIDETKADDEKVMTKERMSHDAIRCHRHGRVVFFWREALNPPVDGIYKCPVPGCDCVAQYDNTWHINVREIIAV